MTTELLHQVARLYSIQADYRDGFGQLRKAPTEAILKVLQALGAPVASFDDLPGALRQRRQTLSQRAIEPVTVAWQGGPLVIPLRLPRRLADVTVLYQIALESGELIEGKFPDAPGFTPRLKEVEGAAYVTRRLVISAALPLGYHRIQLQIGALNLESHLFAAPMHAYAPADDKKRWGIFCPLYALNSAHSWGAGDFADLADLIEFTAELNGHAAATLPLLASFLDEPFNPSPYAPVSRLFWNEFYLDIEHIPELSRCASARAILVSEDFRLELQAVRAKPLVDYRRAMALKRRVLAELCRSLMRRMSARRALFDEFVATHPLAQDYAAFRAAVERERQCWPHWQSPSRDGVLTPEDYDERAQQYHLYVQWQCAEQTRALGAKAKALGTSLYIDFPLGVNRDGYDVWRERQLFALAAAGGAPPDGLFVKGQNWGFPPLHPEALRRQGYRYYIDCLRHHMTSARMLRVDHVMGLHRAFWIPEGFGATDGMYVRYRAPEFYAIFNLESQRHQVQIVGENLGTVPDYVNLAMARHKFLGMHVGQFGVDANPARALHPASRQTVASLNTHDTATFMGFWTGAEIEDRVALDLIDAAQAQNEHSYRAAQREALATFLHAQGHLSESTTDPSAVLHAWLAFIASRDAEFLLVNLEDLWLESEPQNVPGTWQERPNWQRKARYSLAELHALGPVMTLLKTIGDKRSRIS
jgi:4-alpha-glucanotransferase